MKKLSAVICGLLFLSCLTFGQNQPKMSARILLVPLDDRPPCLQMPVRLGAVADAEIVTPPRELLGNFTTPGDSEKIIEWLKNQDLQKFDAAVVSLDMLAYGGLVAMREYGNVSRETAQKRIDFVREMKRRAPRLPVYGSSVIMRLAPTGNLVNEAYRAKLARWAEIVSEKQNAKLQEEARKLEKEIPADALENYKRARERDLAGNFQAIDLVKNGTFEYLILSQDDAHPTGVHVAERESLIAEINRQKLSEKIPVQPGADEVSMLLMARFVGRKNNFAPRILPVYSSEESRTKVMPFEDRKLHETVSYHIRAVGGREVSDETQADMLFYVFGSRLEAGRAKSFAEEIEQKVKAGKRVILVDVDPTAKTEGADPPFAEELKNRQIFRKLSAYAAWNTAGNMIGTALPQSVMFEATRKQFNPDQEKPSWERKNGKKTFGYYAVDRRINQAQDWFLLHRWLDDYIYNTIVRPEIRRYAQGKNWHPFRFPAEANREIEAFGSQQMQKHYAEARGLYEVKDQIRTGLICEPADDLRFELPWNRAFEAEIEFSLRCDDRLILKP
jgi:hypothetical protein